MQETTTQIMQTTATTLDLSSLISDYKALSPNDKLQLLINSLELKQNQIGYPYNFQDVETLDSLKELQKLRTRVITGVACICYVKRDSGTYFLLHKRKGSHGKNTWSVPGGHVDLQEQPQDAVRREVYEEFGLRLKDLYAAETIVTTHFDENGKSYVTLVYFAEIDEKNSINVSAEPKIMEPDKCDGIKWCRWGKWGDLKLFSPLENFIHWTWGSVRDIKFIQENLMLK